MADTDIKQAKLTDKKIIWRMVNKDETFTDYKKVEDFISYIESKHYDNIKVIIDDIMSIVDNNTIHDDLRDEIIRINENKKLGLDIKFSRKYQSYGLARDKLKLVVKFKTDHQ